MGSELNVVLFETRGQNSRLWNKDVNGFLERESGYIDCLPLSDAYHATPW